MLAQMKDEDLHLRRHVGVAFKILAVSGSGFAVEFQNTVDSPFSSLIDILRNYISRKKQGIQIL